MLRKTRHNHERIHERQNGRAERRGKGCGSFTGRDKRLAATKMMEEWEITDDED